MKRCWSFHAATIPEEASAVIDTQGRRWERAGVRCWSFDGVERHEAWLLREHGPVRCPVEDTLKRSDLAATDQP